MALSGLVTGSSESHTLVDCHIVSHHGRFSYNHTGSVINKKTLADGGGRVYFNAGFSNRPLRNVPGYEFMAVAVKPVGSAMHTHRPKPRIEKIYFQRGARRRVSCLYGIYVFFKSFKHNFTFFIYLGRQRSYCLRDSLFPKSPSSKPKARARHYKAREAGYKER